MHYCTVAFRLCELSGCVLWLSAQALRMQGCFACSCLVAKQHSVPEKRLEPRNQEVCRGLTVVLDVGYAYGLYCRLREYLRTWK